MSSPRGSRILATVLAVTLVSAARAQDPDLYDVSVLRTLNLTLEQDNWWDLLKHHKESETGKYLRGTLVVDGIVYNRVGVALRGKASYYYANEYKRPFKIKMDAFKDGQELYGYDSIRLNNGWEDPTFVRDVVMANALRPYVPMPRGNFVKLVINGENWGVYVNEQQKDRKWMREWYGAVTGNRYKSVLGGNLSYPLLVTTLDDDFRLGRRLDRDTFGRLVFDWV